MKSNEEEKSLDPSTWVDEYADYLFSFAISRVRNRVTVEDLVQETFLSALKAKDTFQHKSTVSTWLTSILRNKIFEHYKKSQKSDLVLGSDEEFNMEFFEKGGMGQVWKDNSNVKWELDDPALGKSNFYGMLNNCLAKLPKFHQSVFALKNLEGLDAEEICKVLEISQSNYWVITHRSKLKLQKCVQSNWFNKDNG